MGNMRIVRRSEAAARAGDDAHRAASLHQRGQLHRAILQPPGIARTDCSCRGERAEVWGSPKLVHRAAHAAQEAFAEPGQGHDIGGGPDAPKAILRPGRSGFDLSPSGAIFRSFVLLYARSFIN